MIARNGAAPLGFGRAAIYGSLTRREALTLIETRLRRTPDGEIIWIFALMGANSSGRRGRRA